MYKSHFQLQIAPFNLDPQLEFRFESRGYRRGLKRLQTLLEQPHPLTVLVGTTGTGKTVVLHSLLDALPDNFEFTLVTNTLIDMRDLVKLVLADLNVPVNGQPDEAQLLALYRNHLQSARAAGETVIIAVDEAHNLKPQVLRSLKELLRTDDGSPLPVKILLSGQPELTENVLAARLLKASELKLRRCAIEPLAATEVGRYLQHRLKMAGGKKSIFHKNAVKQIMALSGGVPRLINSLAANGMQSAYFGERNIVTIADIKPLDGMVPSRVLAKSAPAQKPPQAAGEPKAKLRVQPSTPKPKTNPTVSDVGDDHVMSFVRRTVKAIPEIKGLVILHGQRGVLAAHIDAGIEQSDLIAHVHTIVANSGDVSEKILDSTFDYTVIRSVDGVFVTAPVMADTTLALYTEGTAKLGIILTKLGVWRQELRGALKEALLKVG